MSLMLLEIISILLLLMANGLFAMSETAIVSSKKHRLQQWAESGNRKAKRALKLSNDPDIFLSTAQIGITLVGVLSGAVGGATIAEPLQKTIAKTMPFLRNYAEAISIGIVVSVITFASIVIGELVPKRIALRYPERIASFAAGPMLTLSRLTAPLVHLLAASTNFILHLLGMHRTLDEPSVTGEEIRTLVEQGTQAGVFEKSEQAIMERVLSFGEKKVSTIMTHRRNVIWIDTSDPVKTMRIKLAENPHSQFPVAHGALDNLEGVVHTKDLCCHDPSEKIDFEKIMRQPIFIPETADVLDVLETFKTMGVHIGIVIDEYGSIQGIVTVDDILKAIVGDLPARSHQTDRQIVRREDGTWLIDGMLNVDRFKELFKISKLPGEEKGAFQTVAGFLLHYSGRIPTVTDRFTWGRFEFEILDMDANRIDKILVTEKPPFLPENPQQDRGDRPSSN